MKTEIRIYHGLTAFFLLLTVVYGYMTYTSDSGIEWVGVPALLLTALMSGMIGLYLELVAKRIDARPEDDLDGEIKELAGEQGTFAPYSWWPLPLAAGAGLMFLGMAVGLWVMLFAIPLVAWSVIGWTFEFYRGEHAH